MCKCTKVEEIINAAKSGSEDMIENLKKREFIKNARRKRRRKSRVRF